MKLSVSILAAADGSDEEDEIVRVSGRHCRIPVLCSGRMDAVQTKDKCFLSHRLHDREQVTIGKSRFRFNEVEFW